jgi:hypothetical protein
VTPYTGQSLIWRPKTSGAINRESGSRKWRFGAGDLSMRNGYFFNPHSRARGIGLNVAIKGDMWRSENMIFRCMFAPKEISRNLLKISFHLPTLIIRKRGPI